MSAPLLLDTSAALALLLVDHEAHETCFAALADHELGLAGHAAFETYSVLTRLPAGARQTPDAAGRLIEANFPATVYLSPAQSHDLVRRLPAVGIAGGAVYDALVGAAAVAHGMVLASRDTRARETYRALDVDVMALD